jgi:xylulokinase
VRFRLTGEFATDVSDASGTLLFDVTNRRWSHEMLSALDLDAKLLPRAYESVEITGQITPEAAVLTGLSAGTPVVGGAGDQAASAVGNGIVEPGHTFCHAVPGKWHVMGVTQGAGLSLRWFRDNFGASECWFARHTDADAYDLIIDEARKIPPGSGGVLWLPYLMGERTPHLDAQARGMWFGLTAVHTRAHLIRSILEGVAFSLRDSIEIFRELKIPVEQIRSSGGGSRNFTWREIQADIFGRELVTLRTSEGSAFGAALLAGVAAKTYSSVSEAAAESIQVKESMTPLAENVKAYDRYYQVYRDLYPAVRDLAHTLANLV